MNSLRLRYQTIEFGDMDIHVRTLRDTQQFDDKDNIALNLGIPESTWALFGVIWPSSEVLAHMMFDYAIEGKRILEVGCGIGLSSLILNHRKANITATDYHPKVEAFLEHNTHLNKDKDIPFFRTSWEEKDDKLGKFDLIVGSDLLYERDHIELLSSFINNHANDSCEVIIVDPGRGNRNKFSKKMESFGYSLTLCKAENTNYLKDKFKGHTITYRR